jgi:hypothetical protein
LKPQTIKISQQHPTWPFIRQTPNSSGVWGDYRFVFDDDLKECDAWVIIGDILHHREVTKCPPHRILLINEEPPTMRNLPVKYLSQFPFVATCGGFNFNYPGIKEIFPLQPWYIGVNQRALHAPADINAVRFTYDDLKALQPPKKTKLLSVIISDKAFTEGHVRRLDFVRALKTHFSDRLDIFGRGFNYVADKWDAIADYKYHIAIENSVFPHYWTEKLADAFLGWSYPIYYGCPNIDEYFDFGSLTTIDISSPGKAVETIEEIIRLKKWKNSIADLAEARRRVLDEYNMFPMIIRLLGLTGRSEEKKAVTIKSLSSTVGRTRTLLRNIGLKFKFGLGITRLFPFLRRI